MKKDFLSILDYASEELQEMLDLAVSLKKEWQNGGNQPILKNKTLGMLFQKPSLRTRVSFEMGMYHLGGNAMYLSPNEIGLGKRESVADVARVLSGYVDILMARVFEHDHILQLAEWSSIPVINGLSDYNHPCQAMADALTIIENFGSMKGRSITYVGDGNNVAISLMHICAKLGANFTFAGPENYLLKQSDVNHIGSVAQESGSIITITVDPHLAVKNADVIYTDTWTSMGQEEESKIRELVFPPFQVNAQLLSEAREHAIVMHCLPAHRGQEITDEVADGAQSRLFPQAHNRLHAQKAILAYLLAE